MTTKEQLRKRKVTPNPGTGWPTETINVDDPACFLFSDFHHEKRVSLGDIVTVVYDPEMCERDTVILCTKQDKNIHPVAPIKGVKLVSPENNLGAAILGKRVNQWTVVKIGTEQSLIRFKAKVISRISLRDFIDQISTLPKD